MPIDDLPRTSTRSCRKWSRDLAALSAIPPVAFPGFPPGLMRPRMRLLNSCAGMAWTMSGSWTFRADIPRCMGRFPTSRIADGSAVWSL